MARSRGIMYRQLPSWLNTVMVFGTLATVVYFEIKRPLRRMRQDKITRDARNVFMSLTTAATISLTEKPVTAPASATTLVPDEAAPAPITVPRTQQVSGEMRVETA